MAKSTLCTCEGYISSYESKFRGNRMLYLGLIGSWCDIVLNAHNLVKDKSDD
jgi:hypothetical protein